MSHGKNGDKTSLQELILKFNIQNWIASQASHKTASLILIVAVRLETSL